MKLLANNVFEKNNEKFSSKLRTACSLQWRTSRQTYVFKLKFYEMFLSHRHCFGTCLMLLRSAHSQAGVECNYYKTLGLSPSASQAEIKAAYYELSKKHHPDRNHGSEESAKIFRLVKAAYEILGNEKRRMQYDKERIFKVIRKPVSNYQTDNSPDYKDEAERIHYQSRARPPFRRYSYGKTSFYDFDAWYEGHYGKDSFGFEYRKPRQFRTSYHHKATDKEIEFHSKVNSVVTFLFYAILVLCSLTVHKGKRNE